MSSSSLILRPIYFFPHDHNVVVLLTWSLVVFGLDVFGLTEAWLDKDEPCDPKIEIRAFNTSTTKGVSYRVSRKLCSGGRGLWCCRQRHVCVCHLPHSQWDPEAGDERIVEAAKRGEPMVYLGEGGKEKWFKDNIRQGDCRIVEGGPCSYDSDCWTEHRCLQTENDEERTGTCKKNG